MLLLAQYIAFVPEERIRVLNRSSASAGERSPRGIDKEWRQELQRTETALHQLLNRTGTASWLMDFI